MAVQVSFLKCDRYSKVLLSQLMTSSFKGNKLYSLLFRFTEQKARLVRGTEFLFLQQAYRKSLNTYCYLSSSIEWRVEVHRTVIQSFSSQHASSRKDVSSFGAEGKMVIWEGGKKKSLQTKRSDLKLETRVSKWKILCGIYFWSPNNVILTEYRHFPL